jgi:hypothetical protein
MDQKFKSLIDSLHAKYEQLIAMTPVTVDTAPSDTPKGGIYLFTENGRHLYAGRTKRQIKTRLKGHVRTADDCPFAWRLAREATDNLKATYKKEGSQKDLLSKAAFREAYEDAKLRIRKMEVRYVSEPDPLRQALLEIYVAVVTGAKHNDFDTH